MPEALVLQRYPTTSWANQGEIHNFAGRYLSSWCSLDTP